MSVWESLKRTMVGDPADTVRAQPDDFPMLTSSPHYAAHLSINDFYASLPEPKVAYMVKPAQHPIIKGLFAAPAADQFTALEAIITRRVWLDEEFRRQGSRAAKICEFRDILANICSLLFRRRACATPDQAASLTTIIGRSMHIGLDPYFRRDIAALLKSSEEFHQQGKMTQALVEGLAELKRGMDSGDGFECAEDRRARQTIDRLLGQFAAAGSFAVGNAASKRARKPTLLDKSDAWAAGFCDFIEAIDGDLGFAWDDIVAHARTANGSRPSKKWLNEAGERLDALGKERFKQFIVEWLPTVRATERTLFPLGVNGPPMADVNAEFLKGLVWTCGVFDDVAVAGAVTDLAQVCYRKAPGHGPVSDKVANACVATLSNLPGLAPIAQLSRLRLKVKYAVGLRLIDRALREAAEKLGMTTEELEEIAVPTYGLDENSSLRETIGDFTAEVRIVGTDATEVRWIKADGKEQKSVPTQVKENHAAEWKELKRTVQDIENMLPAQRDRLERTLVSQRELEFGKWRERYHDHPMLSGLSRRLVWQFSEPGKTTLAAWSDGQFLDVEDQPVEWLSSTTKVRLWHPLGSEVATVGAWRRWLERHRVTQPFKQAHREIYILTDAEIATETYSNRFAAHIIRQHQFAALARQRGWKYSLQGAFDSHNTPFRTLPNLDLNAEFWVESATGADATSDAGIFLYLSTDQVRFSNPDGSPRRLVDIPALVFSEVMRDVDLFVGVCSVGNDPAWQDNAGAGAHMNYWREFSFGELSANAKTRCEVLEGMLSKLKIGPQCSIDGRFLVVRGSLRTYKIHLGSGNILMEPNDQYLCIVPDRAAAGRTQSNLFLPFEGDHILAIILSKAFLLANDTAIKDSTIRRQIDRALAGI